MFRVHLMPESPPTPPYSVCAEVRLINPFTHPSVGNRVKTSYSFDPGLPREKIDVVVVQRHGIPGFTVEDAADLVRAVRKAGAKLVYDIDDDLLLPHPVHKVEEYLRQVRPVGRFLAREADLITCSTPTLAERFAPFETPRAVWRNAIDDRMMIGTRPPAPSARPGPVVVGYAGTPTHLPDLLSVTESLRQTLNPRAGEVSLDFLGVADIEKLTALFGGLLAATPRHAKGYREYFRDMQKKSGWDVAIAPLQDTPFNHSKSDIKFLEYAVFGVPAVYSRCKAYDTVQDGKTGLLANRETFAEALVELLDSPAKRKSIAQDAYDYVRSERTLEKSAGKLIDIVESIL